MLKKSGLNYYFSFMDISFFKRLHDEGIVDTRTGLALIAATIFTIKYYYAFWPVELEMITMAVIFIASAYLLIRYLKDGTFGFTSLNLYAANNGILNAEALIITQTFNEQATANNAGLYNGRSGGGGGASGDF